MVGLAVRLQTPISQLPTEIDVRALPQGIYFVKVSSEKGSTVQKLGIQ